MPCYSPSFEKEYKQELDKVTAFLCGLCQKLEDRGETLPEDLKAWWEDHKKFDESRRKHRALSKM